MELSGRRPNDRRTRAARGRRARAGLAIAIACGLASEGAAQFSAGLGEPAVPDDRPIEQTRDGYVSSSTCRACHPSQYESWQHSWHRTMTQVVTPESVIGDFGGAILEVRGKRYRMYRDAAEFHGDFPIDDPHADAGERRKQVRFVMSTGSHHMQVYWYPSGIGRGLGMFPLYFLKRERQWIPWSSAFLREYFDHGREDLGRWNGTCLRCHTTDPRPRLVDSEKSQPRPEPDTRVSEFGIACESCHGPAVEHVQANQNPVYRYRLHLEPGPDSTIVNPARLGAARSSEICGQCHGVTAPNTREERIQALDGGMAYRPGAELEATRAIPASKNPDIVTALLAESPEFLRRRFWSDGMVRVGGRELNGLLESPCFESADPARAAVQCTSCHRLHRADDDSRSFEQWADDQLDTDMATNRACLQCHESFLGTEALEAHSHHANGSSGSLCYNCHMPFTAWGLLKATRSHQVSNPSVRETLETGRPNACNACHLDRSLAWTGEQLAAWYGAAVDALPPDSAANPAAVVAALRGDAGQRALAAWAMGWGPAMAVSGSGWRERILAVLLLDPYDAVRFNAIRSLARQPGFEDFELDFLAPESTRRAAADRVIGAWRQRPATDLPLDDERIARLLAERDERSVHLVE